MGSWFTLRQLEDIGRHWASLEILGYNVTNWETLGISPNRVPLHGYMTLVLLGSCWDSLGLVGTHCRYWYPSAARKFRRLLHSVHPVAAENIAPQRTPWLSWAASSAISEGTIQREPDATGGSVDASARRRASFRFIAGAAGDVAPCAIYQTSYRISIDSEFHNA